MEDLLELKEQLTNHRPDSWEQLPHIPLYMDQVVSYLAGQLIPTNEGDALTPAMINNYIKDGLLSRANGKKYEEEHLAYLIAISVLKQVLSVREMRVLLDMGREKADSQQQYAYFRKYLDLALQETAQQLDENMTRDEMPKLVLTLALRSYANGLACRRLLDALAREQGQQEWLHGGKKKNK